MKNTLFVALAFFAFSAGASASDTIVQFNVLIKTACTYTGKNPHRSGDAHACDGWMGDASNAVFSGVIEAPLKELTCADCVPKLASVQKPIVIKNTKTGKSYQITLVLGLSENPGNANPYILSADLVDEKSPNSGSTVGLKDPSALTFLGSNGPMQKIIEGDSIAYVGTTLFVNGVTIVNN